MERQPTPCLLQPDRFRLARLCLGWVWDNIEILYVILNRGVQGVQKRELLGGLKG